MKGKYKVIRNMLKGIAPLGALLLSLTLASCDKTESYSDLLRDEEKAVNWFLAQRSIEITPPESAEGFQVGPDAPFYRMDDDGTVYMQVISVGDLTDRPQEGDKVYFRFQRQNIKTMWLGMEAASFGNMDNLDSALGATYIFYGNDSYPSSSQYGTGIQIPLNYLGYYSEVNLVLKSYSGFTGSSYSSEQTACTPFYLNVKYYKPEY